MHLSTFENCASAVIAFIDAAKRTLTIGVCWFTHPHIFQALQKAVARNVQVTLLLDYDHINFRPSGLDFIALEKAGASVLAYAGPGLMHHKFAVSDGCQVLTGSYNWTRAAQRDHVVVIQDLDLARQFGQAFEEMANKCQRLEQLHKFPPRQLSFSQMYQPALWSLQDLRKRVVSGAKAWLVVAKTPPEWEGWCTAQRHVLPIKTKGLCWPPADILDDRSLQQWVAVSAIKPASRAQLTRYAMRMRAGDILFAVNTEGALLGAGMVGAGAELLAAKPGQISRFVQWLEVEGSAPDHFVKSPPLRSGIIRYNGSALELLAKMA